MRAARAATSTTLRRSATGLVASRALRQQGRARRKASSRRGWLWARLPLAEAALLRGRRGPERGSSESRWRAAGGAVQTSERPLARRFKQARGGGRGPNSRSLGACGSAGFCSRFASGPFGSGSAAEQGEARASSQGCSCCHSAGGGEGLAACSWLGRAAWRLLPCHLLF